MNTATGNILTINGGSSSIKFAVFTLGSDRPERGLHGQISRIGQTDRTRPGTSLLISDPEAPTMSAEPTLVPAADFASVVDWLVDWLGKQPVFGSVRVVGHRVVHGLAHTEPEPITPALLTELRGIATIDPDHLPGEIALIEAIRHRWPDLPQIACFDTAFHRTLPRVAQLLPIPRRFDAQGIRRYGFHGLSYAYLLDELARVAGEQTRPGGAANGRVILAHLGSGASLCAVRDGQSIDTTMGFTPTGGLMMGTRPGDLDPGLMAYLMQSEGLTASQFNDLINHQSGLLGLSETGSDMQDLLDIQATDSRAAEAIDLFCYQVKKGIGAYTAVLDGLDTLVFSGGIGQHAPDIRTRICTGLTYLGIEIDDQRNTANAPIISTPTSRVTIRVIPTDEEQMMARLVWAMIV
jgi:acetate kinase